jgi:phosphoribosylformylglycinamidine cyclo-ligase
VTGTKRVSKLTYKDSGVDIDAGNSLVDEIKPFVKETFDSNVVGGIGSFAGAYRVPKGYENPVLLSATDGVGTKLKLAIDAKRFDTIGIDLVAMCVNDLICNFAKPMFFLDYYATSKLEVDSAKEIIKSIALGCKKSSCALIGGETAEMPTMYKDGDFDLAGFSVGIAEESDVAKNSSKEGDILVALKSSGVHSNGYSLVRKLFFEKLNMSFDDEIDGKKLIDILLAPTEIYVPKVTPIFDKINALSHITGGGLVENLPRVLPENLKAVINRSSIQTLPIFDFISKYVDESEMFRTFNMGVGMVLVVSEENLNSVLKATDGYVIGELKSGEKGVELL